MTPVFPWWKFEEQGSHKPAHTGLYLDRCLAVSPDEAAKDKPTRKHLYQVAIQSLAENGEGRKAWEQRRAWWRRVQEPTLDENRTRLPLLVETTGRMLLHPNPNSSVTDGAVLLHHTWGVPYLPGSGLKGLARHYGRRIAEAQNREDMKQDLLWLFGRERASEAKTPPSESDPESGLLRILDAMWIPGTESPLEIDVVTPHHSAYYTGDKGPTDDQDPIPTERLVVGKGVRFEIMLELDAPAHFANDWLKLAEQILGDALEKQGFSSWTAAGYGRMQRVGESKKATTAPTEAIWVMAELRRNPGSGGLTATLEDRRRAEAAPFEAQRMVDATLLAALKRGPVKRNVQVRALGNRWELVDIQK